MPQAPRAKKVIEHAIQEARSLKHSYVGTEHLLLGILWVRESGAAEILDRHGLAVGTVRAEVRALLERGK
jgi:ATP-dependent Clp protease ATP-binding subunit ClpC